MAEIADFQDEVAQESGFSGIGALFIIEGHGGGHAEIRYCKGAEDLPFALQAEVLEPLFQGVAIDLVAIGPQKSRPITNLAQADAA